MTEEGQLYCACCGRDLPREKLHSLNVGAAYICRRCGRWVAFLWRGDRPESVSDAA
jgi:predicted SprT family Zn-dependent metalloprotease